MYISMLRILMKIRGLNQSDVARIAGISRQSVSLWFKSGTDFQNIQISPLMKLSDSLNISIDELVRPMPLLNDPDTCKALFTEFCWDRLYPDIESFFTSLTEKRLPAMARLVQCRGLFESACILGESVWQLYDKYRSYLHPAKRKECDYICELHKSQMFK